IPDFPDRGKVIRFLHLLGCDHAEQREGAAKHGAQGGSERESVGLALGTDNTIFCVVAVKGSCKLIGVGNKALWRELARGAPGVSGFSMFPPCPASAAADVRGCASTLPARACEYWR